jgi:hypothetical protein
MRNATTTRRPLTADSTGTRVNAPRGIRPADDAEDREDLQPRVRVRKVRLSHGWEEERDWLDEDARRGAFSIWAQ